MSLRSSMAVGTRRHVGRTNMRTRRLLSRGLVRRSWLSQRHKPIREGTTVATVTWNSLPFLEVLVEAVSRFSGSGVELLVIDNNSSDGTVAFLADRPHIRTLHLPFNAGHGYGCDSAMLHADTDQVVLLDVDAFPIAPGWLEAVLGPLDGGATVAGAHVHRSFVHPCFLAMRRHDFLEMGSSFAPVGFAPQFRTPPKGVFMDVGELLCHSVTIARGSDALHRVPLTSVRGPGMAGSVFGDVVYHNFYSTQGDPEHMRASRDVWDDAVRTYLP